MQSQHLPCSKLRLTLYKIYLNYGVVLYEETCILGDAGVPHERPAPGPLQLHLPPLHGCHGRPTGR
jgi:hypothetical protein